MEGKPVQRCAYESHQCTAIGLDDRCVHAVTQSALLLLLPLLVILSQHCLLMVVEGIFLGMLLYGLKPLHIDASEEHGEAQVLVAYISHLFQELLILFVALQFHLSHL